MKNGWKRNIPRLLKWVKYERNWYKKATVRYLETKDNEKLWLFAHWLLVYP